MFWELIKSTNGLSDFLGNTFLTWHKYCWCAAIIQLRPSDHWLQHDEERHKKALKHRSMFSFNNMILQSSPRVVKIDRFDAEVKEECVPLEENRAARIVGVMKSILKNVVMKIVRCFLKGNNMTFPRNLFLKCVFPPTSGPSSSCTRWASSAQRLRRKVFVDAICLRGGKLSSFRSVTEICHNSVNVNHVFSNDFLVAHLTPQSKAIRSWGRQDPRSLKWYHHSKRAFPGVRKRDCAVADVWSRILAETAMGAEVPPIVRKSEVGREVSCSHRVQDHMFYKSWLPQGCIHCNRCSWRKIRHRGLFISMLITNEDPFFNKGFLPRISNQDTERFPMRNLTWHLRSTAKEAPKKIDQSELAWKQLRRYT